MFLNENDKEDFRSYVTKNNSFNPFNMFICKSKKLTHQYYKTILNGLKIVKKYLVLILKDMVK